MFTPMLFNIEEVVRRSSYAGVVEVRLFVSMTTFSAQNTCQLMAHGMLALMPRPECTYLYIYTCVWYIVHVHVHIYTSIHVYGTLYMYTSIHLYMCMVLVWSDVLHM